MDEKEKRADFSFLALAFRQRYIRRWSLMRSNEPEDLSTHAMQVSLLSHALSLIGNRFFGGDYSPERAALLGLFHDLPEIYTGDLPTPVKYASEDMRADFRRLEDKAVDRLLEAVPPGLKEDYASLLRQTGEDGSPLPEARLVKAADKLAAYIKCLQETEGGNREFLSAKEATKAALDRMDCPELDYFFAHCLPAFSATLDEAAFSADLNEKK